MRSYVSVVLAIIFLFIQVVYAQTESEHVLYDLAVNNYYSYHFEDALKFIDRCINITKTDADAWCLKGMILVGMGLNSNDHSRFRSAIPSFQEAIRLRNFNYLAWMGEADALYYLEEYVDALGDYNRSIDINSSSARAWFQKGTVLRALGRVNGVDECCIRAVRLDHKYRDLVPCKEVSVPIDPINVFRIISSINGPTIPANQTLVLINQTIFIIDSRALENIPRIPESSAKREIRVPLRQISSAPYISRTDERIDSRILSVPRVIEPSPIRETGVRVGRFTSAPIESISEVVAPIPQTPSNETAVTDVEVQSVLSLNGTFVAWDLETGDLGGWNKTGNAFDYQPTYGDNPTARGDGPSNHQGNYWIGTYEKYQGTGLGQYPGDYQGDEPVGTLTSLPFVIKGESISFLIGGGKNCSANLVVDGAAALTANGNDSDTMSRYMWNVSAYKGKEATIMLVDSSSDRWGHINFDDVIFDVLPDVKGNLSLELSLNEKGYTLYQLGRYEDSLTYFDRALKLDPFYITALKNKGMALQALGRQNESASVQLYAQKLEGA